MGAIFDRFQFVGRLLFPNIMSDKLKNFKLYAGGGVSNYGEKMQFLATQSTVSCLERWISFIPVNNEVREPRCIEESNLFCHRVWRSCMNRRDDKKSGHEGGSKLYKLEKTSTDDV